MIDYIANGTRLSGKLKSYERTVVESTMTNLLYLVGSHEDLCLCLLLDAEKWHAVPVHKNILVFIRGIKNCIIYCSDLDQAFPKFCSFLTFFLQLWVAPQLHCSESRTFSALV